MHNKQDQMLGTGSIQPSWRRRRMLWVLVRCSDGSMRWVSCTPVPLHCAGACVSLVTPFACPMQGSQRTIPASHRAR